MVFWLMAVWLCRVEYFFLFLGVVTLVTSQGAWRPPRQDKYYRGGKAVSANTIHQPNVGPKLGQRRRRWTNIGLMYRVCWDISSHCTLCANYQIKNVSQFFATP